MPDLGVVNFIKNSTAKGMSAEDIRATLIQHGVSEEIVEASFAYAKHSPAIKQNSAGMPTPPTPRKKTKGVVLFGAVIIVVSLVSFFYFGNPLFPRDEKLIRAVEAHMTAWQSKYCDETFDIRISSIRVGTYSEAFGGWPIFASATMSCGKDIKNYDVHSKTAMTMLRKKGFGYEVFTPDIVNKFEEAFVQAFKELEHSF